MMEKNPEIIIRAMEPEDLEFLYAIENDMSLWGVGNTNVPYSRFALHEYMASATGDIYTDRQVRLMVCEQTGAVVGIVDLANFDPRHLRAEVGIVIRSAFRGRGYGKSALLNIIDYSRTVLHLHQLYAIVGVCNTYCVKLFESVGFQKNARLREWICNEKEYQDAWVMQFFL